MHMYTITLVPCQPSPCLNNGTCAIVNVTDQQCVCVGSFLGQFCEDDVKVSIEIVTIKWWKIWLVKILCEHTYILHNYVADSHTCMVVCRKCNV